jgi:prepilin-type N-terminal cleavage/methylation domain-containing protein
VSARRAGRAGFTLAEVAVTIAVVGLAMVYMLQALSTAKMTAAHTRNLKLSKELALLTLGRIESGLYEEELDDEIIEGNYSEEGYPDFSFQAVIGDENLPERIDDGAFFDNWQWEDDQQEDEDDEELEQPYEKIQIRVISPQIQELKNELVIERWVAWEQLHPPEDDDDQESGP